VDGDAGWQRTAGGLRFREIRAGTGEIPEQGSVVSVDYTITFSQSGDTLGTTRGTQPLTMALGKHGVQIFDDACAQMRVGSSRRLVVPASLIPESQSGNVPKDQEGESLVVDVELISIVTGPRALIPSLLPPGTRRASIMRLLFALSFLPYLLPETMQPEFYHFGDPAAIYAAKVAAHDSLWLGGAAVPLDSLFQ
jgi:hypothetical protein